MKINQWKDIFGYEGLYRCNGISVMVMPRERKSKSGSFYTRKEKIMKFSHDKDGYLIFGMTKEGVMGNHKAHRVIWEYYNGKIKEGLQINHKNGIKDDNRIENLELVTAKQNVHHKNHTLNKMIYGESVHNSILKKEDIISMRKMFLDKKPTKEIANYFGVSYGCVQSIKYGYSWKHV